LSVEVCAIDTDSFGTFSGETPRLGTPYETAVAKARAGMSAANLNLGIASEGSIGPDPVLPLGTSDLETMVFVDDELGIVVSEGVRSLEIVAISKVINTKDVSLDGGLDEFLAAADFPRHGLIVKSIDSGEVVKGITERGVLTAAIAACANAEGDAIVESDFRAHFSPSRMPAIAECAQALANRLARACRACGAPGWGKCAPLLGLPCAGCGREVSMAIRAEREGCVKCEEVQVFEREEKVADPKWCEFCNP